MNEGTTTTGKGMYWTGVGITALISLFFCMPIYMELTKGKEVVEGMAKYGYPEGCIQYIGVALLVSTVLYAIPRTTVLGAILLTGYLGGAVATHVHASESGFFFPVIFGVLAWLGVFLRDARVRQLLPWSK